MLQINCISKLLLLIEKFRIFVHDEVEHNENSFQILLQQQIEIGKKCCWFVFLETWETLQINISMFQK